jgi:hypothetical protein
VYHSVPMISWESPSREEGVGTDQDIADGRYDAYLQQFAVGLGLAVDQPQCRQPTP